MPSQNGPSETVKAMIDRMNGSMWTTCAANAWAAGGTATARAQVAAAYRVPDAARMLLGWRPLDIGLDLAVNESGLAVFDIIGVNFPYQPQEVICGNSADAILKDGQQSIGDSEYYDVFAPVKGGETWDVGVEPLDAIAGNRECQVEFTWCDKQLSLPTIYSQASREVGSGTTAAVSVAGTTLNINNCHKLIEVGGIYTGSTKALEKPCTTTVTITCTVLQPVQSVQFAIDPVGALFDGTTDFGFPPATLARRPQRLRFTTDRASVNCSFFVDTVDGTTAGQLAHYIRWI